MRGNLFFYPKQVKCQLMQSSCARSICTASIKLKKNPLHTPRERLEHAPGVCKGFGSVGLELRLRLNAQSVFCRALSKSVFSNECFLG